MRLSGMLAALLLTSGCGTRRAVSPDAGATAAAPMGRDQAIASAKRLYREKKAAGLPMENGPCLGTVDGWAVDVAHKPRLPIDDLPQNQCDAYRNGTVRHFVELDPNGALIRAE